MIIELYQIDIDLDYDGVCFKAYDELEDLQMTKEIDASLYVKVFNGETGCEKLSDVYLLFNLSPPVDHRGRSMSVSDVVAVIENETKKYYYCDSVGFKEIHFKANEARDAHISVVLCEPGKLARVVRVNTELKYLQDKVGGYIETYYPFVNDNICFICNGEGKLNGMELNRSVEINGEITEIIAGPFIICGFNGPNFASLSVGQQDKYSEMFKYPELFFRDKNYIKAVRYNPEKEKNR